jgi:hypothetical protein
VTLPAGTLLRLALEAPLSSESAVSGAGFEAVTTRPVSIEGVEAVPEGSRATGRVTHAASAEQAQGRGEMTLALESVRLADGASFDARAKPLGLRAPAARKKEDGLARASPSWARPSAGSSAGGGARRRASSWAAPRPPSW